MREVDFRKQKFDYFAAMGATFEDCDFTQARFTFAALSQRPQSIYRRCHFDRIDLRSVDPGQARFEQCTFDDIRIEGWFSYQAEFVDCHFSGKIVSSKFGGRVFGANPGVIDPPRAFNEFRGNDFSRADLIDTAFVMGIDYDKQTWPSSSEYVRIEGLRERILRARAEAEGWTDEKARKWALIELSNLLENHADQHVIVMRRVDPKSPVPAAAQRRIVELLEAS